MTDLFHPQIRETHLIGIALRHQLDDKSVVDEKTLDALEEAFQLGKYTIASQF